MKGKRYIWMAIVMMVLIVSVTAIGVQPGEWPDFFLGLAGSLSAFLLLTIIFLLIYRKQKNGSTEESEQDSQDEATHESV